MKDESMIIRIKRTGANKWNSRKLRELASMVIDEQCDWEIVSKRLGCSVEECKKQYERTFVMDPSQIEEQMRSKVSKKSKDGDKSEKESDEKKKKRSIRKHPVSRPVCSVSNPLIPTEFALWSQERQDMWMRIPFDANAYYMQYLPPGEVPQPEEWQKEEIVELMTTTEMYPPNGKWGLLSLHMKGRTGNECYAKFLQNRIEAEVAVSRGAPAFPATELEVVRETTPEEEAVNPPIEKEAGMEVTLEKDETATEEASELEVLGIVDASSEKSEEMTILEDPVESKEEKVIESLLFTPTEGNLTEKESQQTSACDVVSPTVSPTYPKDPKDNEITVEEPAPTAAPSRSEQRLVTPFSPPRASRKRIIRVVNDSPAKSIGDLQSSGEKRVMMTPIKPAHFIPQGKAPIISPTKTVDDESTSPLQASKNCVSVNTADFLAIDSHMALPLSDKMKMVLIQQERERNRFQTHMKKLITCLQTSYEAEKPNYRRCSVENANRKGITTISQLQSHYLEKYTTLKRTLQIQYNSMIQQQLTTLQFYSSLEGCDSLFSNQHVYNLIIPQLSLSVQF